MFFPIELTSSLSSSSPQEIVALQRSTPILSERVGHRFHITNGRRLFPITITAERIGHCLGEFAPTRKRPVPPAAKLAQIKNKKAVSKK